AAGGGKAVVEIQWCVIQHARDVGKHTRRDVPELQPGGGGGDLQIPAVAVLPSKPVDDVGLGMESFDVVSVAHESRDLIASRFIFSYRPSTGTSSCCSCCRRRRRTNPHLHRCTGTRSSAQAR